ncbi:MAG: ATP-binding protein [Cyclobacteriaceae bacterium]
MWFCAVLLWMTEAIAYEKHFSLIMHLVTIIIQGLILYFNSRSKPQVSAMLFLVLIYIMQIYFSYFASNFGAEFGMILLAPLACIFYDDRRLLYTVLVVSFLSFWLPHYLLRDTQEIPYSTIIPNEMVHKDAVTKFLIFLFVYITVAYFKKLNHENEYLLAEKNHMLSQQRDNQMRSFVNIAHEIRTPLTIIKGNTDLYVKDKQGKDLIHAQIGSLNRLVTDIIDISRMESGLFAVNLEEIELVGFVYTVYQSFAANFKQKEVNYSLEVPSAKALYVDADVIYLERVIANLLANALKFTPRGGAVRLAVSSTMEQCALSVSDTGNGIPVESQPAIFRRFFQAGSSRQSVGGSGIGLFFSKNIVNMHGGKLSFDSEPGSGTTFTILLPLKRKGHKKPVPVNKVKPASVIEYEQGTFYDILIVEDNLDMQRHLNSVLSDYSLRFADNGRMAINILDESKSLPQLILTDYMMPEMNGLDFIRQLRDQEMDTPVVVLSALADQFKQQEMVEMGITDYIRKPFDLEELKAIIRNSVTRHASREEILDYDNAELPEVLKSSLKPYYDYIYDHSHDRNLSVQTLCDEFAVSQSTLYRKIKRQVGMNTREFITEVKLHKVRHMAESGNVGTVKSILSEIGWTNSTYLYNTYRTRFGVDLRERLREDST